MISIFSGHMTSLESALTYISHLKSIFSSHMTTFNCTVLCLYTPLCVHSPRLNLPDLKKKDFHVFKEEMISYMYIPPNSAFTESNTQVTYTRI